MNSYARTPSKTKELKQKAVFKREIKPIIVPLNVLKPLKNPFSLIGKTNGCGRKIQVKLKGWYRYQTKNIKTDMNGTHVFSRPQLIGKLFREFKDTYRIIGKY